MTSCLHCLVLSQFARFCVCSNRWRVAKRPGLDAFLKEMAQLYEIVVFTDSMGGLADEVRERERESSVSSPNPRVHSRQDSCTAVTVVC